MIINIFLLIFSYVSGYYYVKYFKQYIRNLRSSEEITVTIFEYIFIKMILALSPIIIISPLIIVFFRIFGQLLPQ